MMESVVRGVIRVALVLVGLAVLAGDLSSAFGLMLGAALSLWQLNSIAVTWQKAVWMKPVQARRYTVSRYMMRYMFIGGTLAAVFFFFSTNIRFMAVLFGLLLVRLVILGYAIQSAIAAGGTAYLRSLITKPARKEEWN